MKRSRSRILTTHAGSLPRPVDTSAAEGEAESERSTQAAAVASVVEEQARRGIPVVNDGELGRGGWNTWVSERLAGFEETAGRLPRIADLDDFPDFARRLPSEDVARSLAAVACTGPITRRQELAVQRDIDCLLAALDGRDVEESFMTSLSPGMIASLFENRHYRGHEEYLRAIADAMRPEYRAIVSAGLVLQVDCSDLLMGLHVGSGVLDLEEFRRRAKLHVQALNHALEGLSPSRMRMHVCWGNYPGPHTRDIPLREMLDILLLARPLAISFPAANPRHAHEWRVWEGARLTHGRILIPGVIDTTTNCVEHPELVAERILRFTRVVGMDNVIAGTDCGFATFRPLAWVAPQVAWAKLDSLVRGADIASGELAPIRPPRGRVNSPSS